MKVVKTRRYLYGLTGYPLGHSISPLIHKSLFELCGIDATYLMVEASPEDLEKVFAETLSGLRGFNVTIPHKINIIKYLDELSPRAELFGAVNTVDVRENKIVGHNTDCAGFLSALQMADIELAGKVLLCGSGGVSRMIAFESVLAGADLTVAVRESSFVAANELKKEIKDKLNKDIKVIMLSDAKGEYDLIINGTPVGMYPNVDACPVSKEVVAGAKAVFDVIYNPQETVLLKYAKEAGIKFSNDDIEKVIKIAQKELEKNG